MELDKNTVSLESEEYLIRMAKKNPSDFKPLYEKYFHQLYWYVFKKVNDKNISGDIVSNVFTKALINLQKFEFRSLPFSSWLYRIAINEVTDYFRKNKRQRMIPFDDVSIIGLGEQMEVEIEHVDLIEKHLEDALKSLKYSEMLLIELRFFEKRSFKEIGALTDQTANNAKVKTYRILNKLRKKLTGRRG